MSPLSDPSVVDLLDEHVVFHAVLRRTRDAVFRRRLNDARAQMVWLASALRRHIDLEEDHLLPIFDSLEHPVPNGAPDIFRRDHRLILDAIAAVDFDGDRVSLCDALGRLQGLLEHHDKREERYFKARLDTVLEPERRRAILSAHPTLSEPPGGCLSEEAPPEMDLPSDPIAAARLHLAVGDPSSAARTLSKAMATAKAERHRRAVLSALERDDRVVAWERLRLCGIASAALA